MSREYIKKESGYTIIETMIAVSLFIIIIMLGMGALLNANLLHNKSKNMRSIMDNLSFIMEDMSKNLRTGYNYHCTTNDDINDSFTNLSTPQGGENCGGIAFEYQYGDPDNDSDQWVYKIESQNGGKTFYIRKSVDSGITWVRLTPDEIDIDPISSFSILGAEPLPDSDQPFVTIKLKGSIFYKDIESPFSLQTSVSQRMIDI